MTRKLALLAALVLTAACSKAPPPPAPTPAPAPAPEAKPVAEKAPEPPPPEPAAVKITEPLVARYVVYLKEVAASRREVLAHYGKDAQRIDREKGVRQGIVAIASAGEAQRALDQAEEKARGKAGVSKEEVAAVAPAVGDVIMARLAWKESKMDVQMAEMQKQMRAAMEKMPPDQRAGAEKDLAEMAKGAQRMNDLTDSRQQYGDEAVDALLKHEAELLPLVKQALAGDQK